MSPHIQFKKKARNIPSFWCWRENLVFSHLTLLGEEQPYSELVAETLKTQKQNKHEHVTEVFITFSEKGVSAEKVAGKLCRQIMAYLQKTVPVGPHLADQLLLPLTIADGAFIIAKPTQHTLTNMETINAFLPGCLEMEETVDGMTRIFRRNE